MYNSQQTGKRSVKFHQAVLIALATNRAFQERVRLHDTIKIFKVLCRNFNQCCFHWPLSGSECIFYGGKKNPIKSYTPTLLRARLMWH